MNDKSHSVVPLGHQIRLLRQGRHWTLAELARRAGTSAPTLHRYENGWDRFELETLRRIAAALEVRLEVRLVPAAPSRERPKRFSAKALLAQLAPLFWDRDLRATDLRKHPGWVLERVLTSGNRAQVQVARAHFGDDELRRALQRRGIDPRTREYWRLILGGSDRASVGT